VRLVAHSPDCFLHVKRTHVDSARLPDAGDGLDCRVVDRLVARLRYLEKTMPESTTVMVNITRTESLDLTRPRLDATGARLTEHMGLSKVSGRIYTMHEKEGWSLMREKKGWTKEPKRSDSSLQSLTPPPRPLQAVRLS
jgi:hypothetical protein